MRKIKGEFTEPEVEYFRQKCNFTEDERDVFELRVRGKSIVAISLALHMSESTVLRRLRGIKNKIIRVL